MRIFRNPSLFRILSTLTLAATVASVLGCSSLTKKFRKKATAEEKAGSVSPRQAQAFRGSISLIDENAQFVLIDGGSSPAPDAGVLLKSLSAETESAQLKVSPERRRPFIIADIVSGTPKVGDQVIEVRPPSPSAPPPK